MFRLFRKRQSQHNFNVIDVQHCSVLENAHCQEHAQFPGLLKTVGKSEQLPIHEKSLEERRLRFVAGQRVLSNGYHLFEVLEGYSG